MNYKNIKKESEHLINKMPKSIKIFIFILVLSAPVIAYCIPFLMTGNKLGGGDSDFLMQTQEAMRISILKYGQFPWWNPWISGGVPLFANPQFGLYSLPSLMTIIFGSIAGYKISLSMYLLIGFWGFYLLLVKAFKSPRKTAILLSYIWVFGSFFAQRIAGHYTFFIILFFPYLLLILLRRRDIRLSWLWLGAIAGLTINAATHYLTIMSLIVVGIFALIELLSISISLWKNRIAKIDIDIDIDKLKFLILSGVTALVFSAQKIYYSFEYLLEYPRTLPSSEASIGIFKAIYAIFGPLRQYVNTPSLPSWSWMEVGTYIGITTGVAAIICLYLTIRQGKLKNKVIGNVSPLTIIILGGIFFIIGLGSIIGPLSPYNIIRHLPILSSMRVATRWIAWSSIMVLIFISLHRGAEFRKLINGLLFISVVELFISGSQFMASQYFIEHSRYQASVVINQQAHFDTKRYGVAYDENLTATTISNIGQTIAGDALIDTRQGPPYGLSTLRCDSDDIGCNFVMTDNAKVIYWSPNIIKIQRTKNGPISINMNPGKYWLINGKYIFAGMRLAEPDKYFTIDDTSVDITIRLQPKYSAEWITWKLTGRY